jgi:hemerythrin-like domain-containing protein
MTPAAPPATPATDAEPLHAFSHCHAGILHQLHEMEQLPALAAAAQRARRIAQATLDFYRDAVLVHHREEEQELFPAVLASTVPGEERERVQAIVARLAQDHQRVEALWREIEPALRGIARGQDAALDASPFERFVADYRGHALYEEEHFLPLCEQILGRNGNHMAALGAALHARHALPEVLRRFGMHM